MSPQGQEPRCVVYGLVDPRDRSIRYIGQTCSPRQRLSAHRHAGPASGWLREIEEMTGERWPLVVLRSDLLRKEARKAEREEIWRHLWRGADLLNGDYPDRKLWEHREHFPGLMPWTSIHHWRRSVQSVPCPKCRAHPPGPCGVERMSHAWGRLARDRRRIAIEFEPHANHHARAAAWIRSNMPGCTGTVRTSALQDDVHRDQMEIPSM
ncbi:hypothetical protein [Streptomyces sp. NPDC001933]|uniref:hypothetical protein n=1 Tax=Streptomyces sp. NPDC001933 TaxID=3364626 RepID=UPI00367C7AE3